jgi:8-oxo-dGTP pyrophosphatase MutT (NUDIX family)
MDDIKFKDTVERLYKALEYRPTFSAIIYDHVPQVLIAKSPRSEGWTFLQGGIHPGESFMDALERELEEEAGILPPDITDILIYDEHYMLDNSTGDKKRFTKGKAFFFCTARYVGDYNLVLNHEEVEEARWVMPYEAPNYFRLGRAVKAELLERILSSAADIIIKREK